MTEYKIYKSQLIIDNKDEMVELIHRAYETHQNVFNGQDSTYTYGLYNFFALTSPNLLFRELFFELKDIIHEYVPEKYKWMQCWLNYHTPDTVLKWHNHEWPYHGYISIDPKNSITEFEKFEVENQVGNIYIGPGYRYHRVVAKDNFTEPRITLGFDICTEPMEPQHMMSLIPL
tara:strand:+ start:672 stop:1193 length:522 start_codon:yes stop_codon:yes gene_type:complete